MNYIILHMSFGAESLKLVASKMTQPVILLGKNKKNDWLIAESGSGWEFYPLKSLREMLEGADNVINWGNHIFNDASMFGLNSPKGVALASHKGLSRRILHNAGVNVPRPVLFDTLDEIKESVLPVVVRPVHHHGGQEFHVFDDLTKLQAFLRGKDMREWYVSAVFPKTHEYRVHCGHGKVLMINEKPLLEGEIRANFAVNQESWRVLKWHEFNPEICMQSLKAIDALGLDYGAVDIMYNSEDNSVAVCEVNTSPSINSDYPAGKYAAYFSWVIRHGFPPHFEIENGKNVFYSEMLRE